MQYPSQIKMLHRLLPLKLMRGRVPPLSSIKKGPDLPCFTSHKRNSLVVTFYRYL